MAHITDYKVAPDFLAYFINGDMSGFSDEDEAAALAFERAETKGLTNFHWSYETEAEGDFGICAISGSYASRDILQLVNMDEAHS